MADFANLATRNEEGNFHVVIEAPRGSSVKLRYDPDLGAFVFQRALLLGTTYPYDWGFVPSTRAPDGDPLDALVLFDAPTWPGVVIPSIAIGVIRVSQREEGETKRNDRIIAVPAADERLRELEDLPSRTRTELEQFFLTVTKLTGKHVHIEGWEGATKANAIIDECAKAFADERLAKK